MPPTTRNNACPVSYTHLDVYKRQLHARTTRVGPWCRYLVLPTHVTPTWPPGSRVWPLPIILGNEYDMGKAEIIVFSHGIDREPGRNALPSGRMTNKGIQTRGRTARNTTGSDPRRAAA